MNKIIFLIFLLFLGSCSERTLPKEELRDPKFETGTGESNIKNPNSLVYDLKEVKLYVDSVATPNKLTFKGEKTNLNFIAIPALPTGLVIDQATGDISGTPTELKVKSTYTIRVQNSHGFETTLVTIEIVIPPPKNLNYQTLIDVTLVNKITNLQGSPTVEGVVTSYSINPALPTGLSLNPESGEVVGIAENIKERIPYTIKAINSTGFTYYTFLLRVIDIKPANLQYDVVEASYMVNQTIINNNPASDGGIPSSYSIDPITLPSGLFFDSNHGFIFGRPLSEVASFVTYTITAINSGGTTSTDIKIKVEDISPATPIYQNPTIKYTKDSPINPNILICAGYNYSFTNCPEGKPTKVTLNPVLPEGLSYNTYTGVISGTPTELTPITEYTVTVSNTGGTKTSIVSLGVIDRKPENIRYRKSSFEIRKNEPFNLPSPFNDGGPVVSYSLLTPIPDGLLFDELTGKVTGTPTTVTVNPMVIRIKATNSGGDLEFNFSIKVLPVPYYSFSSILIKKDYIGALVEYSFEITNNSREYDDSVGINLSMPMTLTSTDPNIIFNSAYEVSTCLGFNNETNPLLYESTCIIKFTYPDTMITPINPIMVSINATDVFTRTFDLRDYLNITPKNLLLTSERGTIVKAVKYLTGIGVDRENKAFSGGTNAIVPILNKGSSSPIYQQDADNASSTITDEITPITDLMSFVQDPDGDGDNGNKIFNNMDFVNKLTLTGTVGSYDPECLIVIPFTPLAQCDFGIFNIASYGIHESGKLKVNITVKEGLPTEAGESNEINVDVYQFKRISFNELPPKRIIPYQGKIYFAGLMDETTNNSRKLLSYSPTSGVLRQVSEFLNNGDDRPFPFAEHDDWLFFKGREPGTNYIKFYVYGESSASINDEIKPLYTATQIESIDKEDDLPTFKFQDKIYFPIEERSTTDKFWVVYDKLNNTFKKMFNLLEVNTPEDPRNGKVDPESFIAYNNKLFFLSYIHKNNSTTSGYKLQSIDYATNIHKRVSNINNGKDDYLSNGIVYDNKIFYITRNPLPPIQSSLIYYDETLNTNGEFVTVLNATGNGTANIIGVAYGKLFFTLPNPDRDELFFYDGSSRTITKVYTARATGNKILKIGKFSNLENKQIVYFVEKSLQGNHLMVISQELSDINIKQIVDGRYFTINEDLSMFNYNNTLFFACDNSSESLCTYNSETETVSKMAESLSLKIHTLPMGQKSGVILFNNRVYLGSDRTATGQKAGIFELCLKGENGCADSL